MGMPLGMPLGCGAWDHPGPWIEGPAGRDGGMDDAIDGAMGIPTEADGMLDMLGMLLIGGMLARLCMPDPTPGICMPKWARRKSGCCCWACCPC